MANLESALTSASPQELAGILQRPEFEEAKHILLNDIVNIKGDNLPQHFKHFDGDWIPVDNAKIAAYRSVFPRAVLLFDTPLVQVFRRLKCSDPVGEQDIVIFTASRGQLDKVILKNSQMKEEIGHSELLWDANTYKIITFSGNTIIPDRNKLRLQGFTNVMLMHGSGASFGPTPPDPD